MKLSIEQTQDRVMDLLKATIEVCDKNNVQYYAQAGTVLGAIRHQGPIPWDHDADIIIPNNEIDRFAECANKDLPDEFYVDYYKVNSKSLRQFPRIGLKGYTTDGLHLDVFRLIGLPDQREEQEAHLKATRLYESTAAGMRKNSFLKLMAKRKFKLAFGKLGLGHSTIKSNIELFESVCSQYDYDEAAYVANPSGQYGVKNIFRKEIYGEGLIVPFRDFQIRIPSSYDFYLKQYYGDYMKFPSEEHIKKEMARVFEVKRT